MQKMTPKEQAHWLAENFGWHVFPALADKKPACKWKDVASNNHDAIDAMPWGIATFAAVYCGKSGISVLDIDTREGREELARQLGGLPSTMQQQTPRGGTHLIFREPGFHQTIGTGIPCDGVDIRSGVGYICWYGEGAGLDWDMLAWPYPAPMKANINGSKPAAVKITGKLPVGHRNGDLTSVAGVIMSANPKTLLPTLVAELKAHSLSNHAEPLEDAEIVKVAKSIFTTVHAKMAPEPAREGNGWDAADLMREDFPPIRFVCEPFISEGYTIYVGKPKIGKTTLMRQLVVAANTGATFMDEPCIKTRCLFLSLEESPVQFRAKLKGMGFDPAAVAGIRVEFEWPKGDEGIARLRQYLTDNPGTELIIVDSLSAIRGSDNPKATLFQQEYDFGRKMLQICSDFTGLAIIAIHHTRKAESEDPMDLVSGTNGVSAACTSVGILHKIPTGFAMHWESRNWPDVPHDYEIIRDGGRWRMIGPISEDIASLPPNATGQAAVINYMREHGMVSQVSMARDLGVSQPSISRTMARLIEKGVVSKSELGFKLII